MSKDIIKLLSSVMDASTLRHKVHSNNIANINTPNYKRQIVSFEEELQKSIDYPQKTIPLKLTNTKHLDSKLGINPLIIEDKTSSLRTDHNNVDLDLELALLAENTIRFDVLTQSLNKQFSFLRSAIKGGR